MNVYPSIPRKWVAAVFASLAIVSTGFGAIHIDGFAAATNDRFANDPDFLLASQDLSGVALTGSGRWVTMLSSNVFVTAHHFAPSLNESVTFYAGNDSAGSSFSAAVESTTRLGSTDIRLGVLDTPLPAGYAFYDVLNYPIPPNTNAIGVYMFGRSPSSLATPLDMAVGRNVMDTFEADFSVSSPSATGDAGITTDNDPGDFFYVDYESQLASGDSGGPVMAIDGGELTIVGVNWFIGSNGGGQDLSGFSYLPNYATEIEEFISSNSVSPVPEPALFGLALGCGGLAMVGLRRRPA